MLGLSQPTDIVWERIGVSDDMLDINVCDDELPPKWNSSLSISKYTPEEEYQQYPGRTITYYKLTSTISGYQPKEAEIEGRLNWNKLNANTVLDPVELEKRLEQYHPCTGAIIQVAVGAPPGSDVAPEVGPYIMDFQPKKRELYELATDTQESVSRTLETLTVGKSAGTTESGEILDVDKGFATSTKVAGEAGVTGPGGVGGKVGGAYESSYSKQGEWGTKNLTQDQKSSVETFDRSTERREGQSHTTQLSQLYHLFDSYHQGTNRAIFFVQPRPHVKEVPTGFVRGPRAIEGIQEMFLVVNHPEDVERVCFSVRMDTGHLIPVKGKVGTEATTYNGNRPGDEPVMAIVPLEARPPLPTKERYTKIGEPFVIRRESGITYADDTYSPYEYTIDSSVTWDPKSRGYSGYRIDTSHPSGGIEIRDLETGGTTTYDKQVDPNGEYVRLLCRATSSQDIWLSREKAFGWIDDTPKEKDKKINESEGHCSYTAVIHLRTRETAATPTATDRGTPINQSLLVTTRGLRYCPGCKDEFDGGVKIVEFVPKLEIPELIPLPFPIPNPREPEPIDPLEQNRVKSLREQGMMTIHEANAVSHHTQEALLRATVSRHRGEQGPTLFETDYLANEFRHEVLRTPQGRELLGEPAEEIAPELTAVIAELTGGNSADISRQMILDIPTRELARHSGFDEARVCRTKLALMDVWTYPQRRPRGSPVEPELELEEIIGIGPKYARRLRETEITTMAQLADSDPNDLAERIEAPAEYIESWIDQAQEITDRRDELERVSGIGPRYAEQLREMGVRGLEELVDTDPDELAAQLRISTREAESWITQAKQLREEPIG